MLSPYLAMKLIYDVSWWWILYLNRCVSALTYGALEDRGDNVTFSLETIIVELEGGRYLDPIIPVPLADII